MTKTNLNVVGYDRWGNHVSKRVYRSDSGELSVRVRKLGSVRSVLVPYKSFMSSFLSFGYIMEGDAA